MYICTYTYFYCIHALKYTYLYKKSHINICKYVYIHIWLHIRIYLYRGGMIIYKYAYL